MTTGEPFYVLLVDRLLGGALGLSPHAALVAMTAVTAAGLLLIRRGLTDAARLTRIHEDLARLQLLKQAARNRGDAEAVARHSRMRSAVVSEKVKAELPGALAGLPAAVAILAWGQMRLEFVPLRPQQDISIQVELPPSAAGRLVHLVPVAGLHSGGGWVQPLQAEVRGSVVVAAAHWTVQADAAPTQYDLKLRDGLRTMTHPIWVGPPRYGPPVVAHSPLGRTTVSLKLWRPFRMPETLARLAIRPWLAVYLALSAFLYFGGRRALGLR